MFFLPANTPILVFAPFGDVRRTSVASDSGSHVDTKPWKGHLTREDTYLDKHEVWDRVAVANDRDDVPMWARMNIENGNTVFVRTNAKGVKVYGMVKGDLKYVG